MLKFIKNFDIPLKESKEKINKSMQPSNLSFKMLALHYNNTTKFFQLIKKVNYLALDEQFIKSLKKI